MAMFVNNSRKIFRDYSDELQNTCLHLTNVTREEDGTKTSTFTWVIEKVFDLVSGVNYNGHFIRFGDSIHRLRITSLTSRRSTHNSPGRSLTYLLVGLTPALEKSAHVSFSLLAKDGHDEIRPQSGSPKSGLQLSNRKCYVEFSEMGFLPRLPLTVMCRIIAPESAELSIENNGSLLVTMRGLMSDGEHADTTVEVDGRSFSVHRAILCARSPVFRAMFKNRMKERTENRIVVEDSDRDSVEALIRYMYTGQVALLTAKGAINLASLADKYDVQDLLWEVIQYLKFNLRIENAVHLLHVADAINSVQLKNQAVAFIGNNLKEVMQLEDWAFIRSRSDLMEDILAYFT